MAVIVEFGPFRLDPDNALLKRGDRSVDLAPKAFAVLCHLARRPGQLVSKGDLLDAVWGHRFVSESVLKTAINAIRSALADDPRRPTFIETVARRGYRFIAAAPAAPPVPVPAAPVPAPADASAEAQVPESALIGRAAPLATLQERLAAVARGEKQLVLVAGEAGIGKSTLLDRFLRDARRRGAAVATGQCIEQFGSGEPYLPVLDALALLCRGEDGRSWREALRQVAPSWLVQLPWLVSAGDATSAAPHAPDRMVREFGALLDTLTPARPLVLAIEDLHWSDHATVNLLAYLARRRGSGNWLVLASYRPTEVALSDHPLQAMRQELRLHRLVAEIALDAFSERDVDAYLQERFGARGLPGHENLARLLHAHTDGLPLFVANVVDELIASGELAREGDAWRLAPVAPGEFRVPESIAGAIEKQIARLPGESRALLEAASAAGQEFAHGVLAQMVERDTDAVQARCDELARRGQWLHSAGMATLPEGTLLFRYAFRHALYRRVFYERTEPARRLQLHLRAARALQALHGGHADRIAAELAVHWERVRDIALASGARFAEAEGEVLNWRVRAARAAAALFAPADALAHYGQALAANPAPADRARIVAERAALLVQIGAGPQALEASAAALELARASGDAQLIDAVALQRASVCAKCDRPDEAVALARQLLESPSADPEVEAGIEIRLVLADALVALGRVKEADTALAAAVAACGDDRPARKAAILETMVRAHYQRGAFAAGLETAAQARALHEKAGDARGALQMLGRIGVISMLLGRTQEAEAALTEARAQAHRLNHVDGERSAILNLVKLRTDRGEVEDALELLDEGWAIAPGFESPVTENAFLQGYYYCHYLRGDLGSALEDAERILESARLLNALYWRVGAALLVCDLFVYLNDLTRAVALIDEAAQWTSAADALHQKPKIVLKRAWLDVLEGAPERAIRRLATLEAGAIEQPEDVAAIARVRAQAQLASGDAVSALRTVAEFDGAPTAESWALLLALRLRARAMLGHLDEADVERARREMHDVHLPSLEGLVLCAALADCLQSSRHAAEARQWRTLLAERAAHCAASLDELPERRAGFLARFAPQGAGA